MFMYNYRYSGPYELALYLNKSYVNMIRAITDIHNWTYDIYRVEWM